MINDKPLTQNPDRYTINKEEWIVSASKEIQPLRFGFGEPLQDLKAVIEADGIIVDIGTHLLCSKKTLEVVEGMANPHYDVSVNGVIKVKDKSVKLGNTIPIVKVDISKLKPIGLSRETANKKSGVDSVTYIYEGEEIDGIPKGIINQLNYTLVESIQRPGDSFSYWKWVKDGDSKYNIDTLKIDNAQEDGKFDPKKLKTFITGVNERLKLLRNDFHSLTDTFKLGDTPSAEGIELVRIINASAKPEDDIVSNQYVKKTTTLVGVAQSATQTAVSSSVVKIDNTKKELGDRIDKTTTTLQQQLASEQAKDSIQQQQIREDLQSQITRNDAYYREKYGNQTK